MSTALVLIDLQNDYFPGGAMELVAPEAAVAEAARLLAAFRARGFPVFHVRHECTGAEDPFFLPGTEGAEIHSAVRPHPNELIFTKHFPNSFRETSLLESLRTVGATRLVFAGMMTHMCVDTTVRAAADFGFECALAHDGCATTHLQFGDTRVDAAQVQAAYLAALADGFAKVTTASELCSEI